MFLEHAQCGFNASVNYVGEDKRITLTVTEWLGLMASQ